MNDNVRKYIQGAVIVCAVGLVLWFGNGCGFTLTCKRAEPPAMRTPIPTLLPATLPAPKMNSGTSAASPQCRVAASDLIGAWVSAGASEKEVFQFTDVNGGKCEAAFADVAPLFTEPNLWYSGSLPCVSCHSADVTISLAQLDLSGYAGIQAGSRRANADAKKGADILGGGAWKKSTLYDFISAAKADVPGHTKAASDGALVFAGKPLPAPAAPPALTPTVTPTP
jgi:hypothetical protein